MKPKRLQGFVAYLLTFVAVLTALGAVVGLVAIYASDRFSVLVQRAGAHYRFIHRTFQEHVAALTDETIARLVGV